MWFQRLRSPVLDVVMQGVTMMGETLALVLVIGVMYWCVDKDEGERMALIMASGLSISAGLKNLFRVPRPFVLDERIVPVRAGTATGYSLPSGHAQNAAMAAGGIMRRMRGAWRAIPAAAVALVMLSRVYLGVHTPLDVLTGALVGAAWVLLGGRLYGLCARRGGAWRLLFLLPSVLSLAALLPLWHSNPAVARDTVRALGLCAGLVAGTAAERRFIGFDPRGGLAAGALKLVVGAGGALALERGLGALFAPVSWLDALRYAAVGIYMTVGVAAFSRYVLENDRIFKKSRKKG